MTYYASFGELLLIGSLLFASHRCFHSIHTLPLRWGISSAMLFVATTATFGVFRFAGVGSVVAIHDITSWLSTHFAMPLYAVLTALIFADKRISNALLTVLLINTILNVLDITVLTNVVLFIALALTAYLSKKRMQVVKAMVAILLVPLTAMLPVSQDLQMGLFHVLLACHFYLISELYQGKSTKA